MFIFFLIGYNRYFIQTKLEINYSYQWNWCTKYLKSFFAFNLILILTNHVDPSAKAKNVLEVYILSSHSKKLLLVSWQSTN